MGESNSSDCNTNAVNEPCFEDKCHSLRSRIGHIGDEVKALMGNDVFERDQDYPEQHDEMKANIMLAYRYLEDARMRVGKALQAAGDGVSILDK